MQNEGRSTLFCWHTVLLFLAVISRAFILVVFPYFGKTSHTFIKSYWVKQQVQPRTVFTRNPTVDFAYIVQTEKCLPSRWLTNDHLGNSTLCNCHVYVLSYREPCEQNSSHVFYLHNKTVGWSGGRNLGYFAARKCNYLYYIFFDDDVVIHYNQYTPKSLTDKKIPPLRIFTSYLLEDLPAAASIDYQLCPYKLVLDKWHNRCNRTDTPKTYPVYHIDAIINAFHRDTALHLLPYYEKHDNATFWLSQVYLMFKFQMIFYGRFELFPILSAYNPAHRYDWSHAHAHIRDPLIRKDQVEKIKEQTPAEYKNHPRFDSMMGYKAEQNLVGVLCVDPTKARTPIIPYQNMEPNEIY